MKTPICDDLETYLDGSLVGERRRDFTAHLVQCPSCREALAAQRQLDGLFAEARVRPEPVPQALIERIRARVDLSVYAYRRVRRYSITAAAAALAVATSVPLLSYHWGQSRTSDQVPRHTKRYTAAAPTQTDDALAARQQVALILGSTSPAEWPATVAWLRTPRIPRSFPALNDDRTAMRRWEAVLQTEPGGPIDGTELRLGSLPFEGRSVSKHRILAERSPLGDMSLTWKGAVPESGT